MAKRLRETDVDQLDGVSWDAFCCVVNFRANTNVWIKEKTRLKWLEAGKTLGYEPNDLARRLRSGTLRTVGSLIPARKRACLKSLFQQRLGGLITKPTFIDLFPTVPRPLSECTTLERLTTRWLARTGPSPASGARQNT